MVIQRRGRAGSAPAPYSRKLRTEAGPATVYGLITVLPGEPSSPEQHRVIVVSGISSVGVHGAMEFFSSPEKLAALRERFRQQGLPGFPPAYQLVVECRADDTLLLSAEYAGHEVKDALLPRQYRGSSRSMLPSLRGLRASAFTGWVVPAVPQP